MSPPGERTKLPVLVHDMPKVRRTGYRLPITQDTANLLVEQQQAVRQQFPDTPLAKLALWPAPYKNPYGSVLLAAYAWQRELRRWARQLHLVDGRLGPDANLVARINPDGQPVRFSAEAVHAYAFRHTYAQRHIDAGTPVQVLQSLLDTPESPRPKAITPLVLTAGALPSSGSAPSS